MGAARKKVPELPKAPQVGDQVRIKPGRIEAYRRAGELAGYDFDPYAIRIVIREDNWAPHGGRRLWIEGPPHMLAASDVILAWNTEDERRDALRARGWRV